MMPSNDFQACLESPYLREDPEAVNLVGRYLEKARSFYKQAQDKRASGGDPIEVILLAYQSMFNSAQALVHSRGYHPDGFRCLLIALKHLFVREGKLEDELLESLVRAQGLLGDASEDVQAAARFLERAQALLEGEKVTAAKR